ncbi:SPAG4 protein, partial [Heliornis fulica]|nr:SPAG4 protein [Heliornis fulica]
SPGFCWLFQGSQSEVLIQLPTQIQPVAVTIQHMPMNSSLRGTDTSAPRNFTVSVSVCRALRAGTWLSASVGADSRGESQESGGRLLYSPEVTLLFVTVSLQSEIPRAFKFLKLAIQSNWGKQGYTCIYRVQVSGKSVGTS